ncbi:hypothetical protein, partial [Streptomyces otsuchiensis]|uniref:hypothetical protein n=1 Tax=Streptomyces otsuchiensis TaxID=2681388 RepID=UPI001300AB43
DEPPTTGQDSTDATDHEAYYGPEEPWWGEVGPIGAVGIIVAGIAVAVWAWTGMPGVAENPATTYYEASRFAAIGLVVAGTWLLAQLRSRRSRHTQPSPQDS